MLGVLGFMGGYECLGIVLFAVGEDRAVPLPYETASAILARSAPVSRMLGCPHCLDYHCQEPTESCVRRNRYISSGPHAQPARTKRHTQGTTPRDVSKLPTYYGFFLDGEFVTRARDPLRWRRRHYRHFGYFPDKGGKGS